MIARLQTRLTALTLSSTMLSGVLPLSLTNLSMLDLFWFDNTDLCEPNDAAFQAWLQGISQVQSTGCTLTASEASADLPESFMLLTNYPNPFNPQTTIPYTLTKAASVHLVVYDSIGRYVRMLVDGIQLPGWHEVIFEADDLPSGVYFYRFQAGSFQATGQMLLVR